MAGRPTIPLRRTVTRAILYGMTDFLHSSREGRILHVVLDRPKALNSLDLDMCLAFHEVLDEANADDSIEAVVTTSASPKAFCAGGDIKQIRQAKIDGDEHTAREFFEREYEMNLALAQSATPVVSVMHGATMGGGMGISIHGSHRVVTPGLLMAMPETAIGFIPDVGASYFLPRLEGGGARGLAVGLYLGMTGARMDAADALHVGLATHLVPEDAQDALVTAIAEQGLEAGLAAHTVPAAEAGESRLAAHLDRIEKVFGAGDAAAILAAAEADAGDEWGDKVLDQLRSLSPTSQVCTVELLRAGAESDVARCLQLELALGAWTISQPDFIEGVRAVLVDKDRNPTWVPATVEEVDPAPIRAALASVD